MSLFAPPGSLVSIDDNVTQIYGMNFVTQSACLRFPFTGTIPSEFSDFHCVWSPNGEIVE